MNPEMYVFVENGSTIILDGGVRYRNVTFTGEDPKNQLFISGSVPRMPEQEYFRAGMNGTMSEAIRDHIIARLHEGYEEEESAE